MNKTTNNLIIKTLGVLSVSILSIMFVLPSNAHAGFYSVSSGMSSPGDSQAPVPVPIIYSISPDIVNTSVGTQNYDTKITITGSNFIYGSVARFNNIDKVTTFISSNTISMMLTASDMSGIGAFPVTVLNPNSNNEISNTILFHLKRTNIATTTNTSNTNKSAAAATTTNSNSSLAAGALFGSNGLMPSSLMGWILLLTLVLLIVVFARKAFFEEKNKAVPLKHH